MDVQNLISKFRELNYELHIQGGSLRYQFVGSGDPSHEVLPLIGILKERKAEVVAYLQQKPHIPTEVAGSQNTEIPSVVDSVLKAFEGEIINVKPPQTKVIAETQLPATKSYELTEDDLKLDEYIGKPSLNPYGYTCIKCGSIAGRYCLGEDRFSKIWWGWQCLKCRPY